MPFPLLVAISAAPAPAPPPPPRPLVVGHRGARARFPENTLPAVRHALESGADAVEVDVRVTSDDVLVLFHDATIPPDRCRMFDGRPAPAGFAVRALAFEALRSFDCGFLPDPRFPAQRAVPETPPPSLDELLGLIGTLRPGDSGPVLFLELKRDESPALSPAREPYARLVVDALGKRGFAVRTVVLSFDHGLLRAVRTLDPTIATMPLVDRAADLAALARREEARWIGPRHTLLTRESVEAARAAGARLFAWTANDPAEQDRLAGLGVDAIGTDDPASLVARRRAGR
jgi:glycerophosphoryl diester phosphodiesterase